jgi:cell division protease FtsH
MQKKLSSRKYRFSSLGYSLGLFLTLMLIQMLFGGALRATNTGMTYTEFKTALRAGQIETARVGIDQVSGQLAGGKAYHTLRVDDPHLLRDLEANKVNTSGQVAGNGRTFVLLGLVLSVALLGVFGYFVYRGMKNATADGGRGRRRLFLR